MSRIDRTVLAVVVTVPVDQADLGADRLWSAGAMAVEERAEAADQVALWSHLGDDAEVALRRLGELPTTWHVRFVSVDDAPAESWRDHAGPVRIDDSLVLRPAWVPAGSDPAVVEVAIEPAGSFGLGDHPTTVLSATAVRRLVRNGDRVLDVGCGSGVLGIVALRFGAARVTAIDVSEAAREATLDNARRNGVADRLDASTTPVADVPGTFDLVVANILAPALVAMADELVARTSSAGTLVVSGVLAERHDHVVAALTPLRVSRTDVLDGWAAVELRHP